MSITDPKSSELELSNDQALQGFLLDTQCLDELIPWTSKFNLFDVLKISKTEIRHSNILSWLLNPNENHNMQDLVIRGVMEHLIKNSPTFTVDIYEILVMDFHTFNVYREQDFIDILLVSKSEKFVICIENKVFSSEHSNQLNRYYERVNKHYSNYKQVYIYLTPEGETPSDLENWQILSYADLLKIIENSKKRLVLSKDAESLIKQYIETVRWHIVGDTKLIEICNQIYNKHRKALDIIFEYKIDTAQQISEFLKKLCKEKASLDLIKFDPKNSIKTHVRFTTLTMTKIFPNLTEPESVWNDDNLYFYQIENRNNMIKIILTIGVKKGFDKSKLGNCTEVISIIKPKDSSPDWVWKYLKTWKVLEYNDQNLESVEAEINEKLEQKFEEIFVFEKKLLDDLQEANIVT